MERSCTTDSATSAFFYHDDAACGERVPVPVLTYGYRAIGCWIVPRRRPVAMVQRVQNVAGVASTSSVGSTAFVVQCWLSYTVTRYGCCGNRGSPCGHLDETGVEWLVIRNLKQVTSVVFFGRSLGETHSKRSNNLPFRKHSSEGPR